MKKLTLFALLTFIISFQLSAQVAYKTQPAEGYYESVKALIMPMVPTQAEMMIEKASPIPVNFKDTILKYDWYEIANYFFYEKEYKSKFSKDLPEQEMTQANLQFEFNRYTPQGVNYRMSLDRLKNGTVKITTVTFDEGTATTLVEVKKVGTKNMLVTSDYGEKEMQEILSYKNGVWIMSIRKSPTDNIKKFHIAYMAVPKAF